MDQSDPHPQRPVGHQGAIFHLVVALDPAKELSAITLTAPSGIARAHVFAFSPEKDV